MRIYGHIPVSRFCKYCHTHLQNSRPTNPNIPPAGRKLSTKTFLWMKLAYLLVSIIVGYIDPDGNEYKELAQAVASLHKIDTPSDLKSGIEQSRCNC